MNEHEALLKARALPALGSSPLWLYRTHSFAFPAFRGPEADALFHALCARVRAFDFAPGARREDEALFLPLAGSPFRFSLEGEVEEDLISAGQGERRQSLLARFPLPGGWELKLRLSARQQIVGGALRLSAEFWFKPGHSLSFRFLIAARALRWALSKTLSQFLPLELNHG